MPSNSLYGLKLGSKGSAGTYGLSSLKVAQTKKKKKDSGSGGLFGTGIGPDFGVNDVVDAAEGVGRDIGGLASFGGSEVYDLGSMLGNFVAGNQDKANKSLTSFLHRTGAAAVGTVSSMGGTAADIADLGASPLKLVDLAAGTHLASAPGKAIRQGTTELLNEAAKASVGNNPKYDQAAGQVAHDLRPLPFSKRAEQRGFLSPLIEDVGNVAIVGKLASMGATGAEAAARAAGAEGAANVAAKAGEVAKVMEHPLKGAYENTVRPVTRYAAEAKTGAVAPEVPDVANPDTMLSGAPFIQPDAPLPETPKAYDGRIPAVIRKAIDRNPEGRLTGALDKLEGLSQRNDVKLLLRHGGQKVEQTINLVAHDESVTLAKAAAQKLVTDFKIAPVEADAMVGKAINDRTVVGPLVEALLREHPELEGPAQQLGRTSTAIPPEYQSPELEQLLTNATEKWKEALGRNTQEAMQDPRLGNKGLENIDATSPTLTKTQEKALARAQKQMDYARRLRDRAVAERARMHQEIGKAQDARSRLASQTAKAIQDGKEAVGEFDRTQRNLPAAFKDPEEWAATTQEIVDRTLTDGGVTYNPHLYNLAHGRFIEPGEQGWAVSVAPDTQLQVSVADFQQYGPELIDQFAKANQRVLEDPAFEIGTWVDGDQVHIDISQHTRDGVAPLTRDQAISLGLARGHQLGIYDISDRVNGNLSLEDRLAPSITGQFADGSKLRDLRAGQARDLINTQPGLTNAMVDTYMQQLDAAANTAHVEAPKEFPKADSFFRKSPGREFRAMLSPDELAAMRRYYGVKAGRWTPAIEARFTGDLIKQMNGVAVPEEVAAGMERIHDGLNGNFETPTPLERENDVIPGTQGKLKLIPGTNRPYVREAATLAERLRDTPDKLPGESDAQFYQRGVKAAQAKAKLDEAQTKLHNHMVAKVQSDKMLSEMQRILAEDELPSAVKAAGLDARAARTLESVGRQLDNAPVVNWPRRWQPLGQAFEYLRNQAAKDPALAGALADIPATFSDVLAKAKEYGFDPEHVREFSDREVERLINAPQKLGGQQETGGYRKRYTGARAKNNQVAHSLKALAAAVVEVSHEKNTNAVMDAIESDIAKPIAHHTAVPKGWVEWAPTKAAFTGARAGEEVIGGAKMIVPEAVATTLKRMGQDYSHGIFGVISKVTNPWRAFVLTLSPRWYVNNFFGNLALATLEGVKIRDWHAAWNDYRNPNGKYAGTGGAVSGHSMVSDITGEGSWVRHGSMKEAWDTGDGVLHKVGNIRREVSHTLRRANEGVDEFARAAVFHKTLRTTGDSTLALQRAYDALIDYGNMSPFEQQVVRSVVPFYAWQKGILKVVAKLPVDHPIVAGLTMQIGELNRQLLRDKYGVDLPLGYAGLLPIPGVGAIGTRGMNPFADALQLTTPEGLAGSMNPFVEMAVRKALGAPNGGFVDQRRVNAYGIAAPDPNEGNMLTDLVTGLPIVQEGLALGGEGATSAGQQTIKGAGINYLTPAQIRKVIIRTRKAREQAKTNSPFPSTKKNSTSSAKLPYGL